MPDLLLAGSLGMGACWGWLLAPLAVRTPMLAWAALSTASLAALAAGPGDARAAVGCIVGAAVGSTVHRGWRRRLRRTVAR